MTPPPSPLEELGAAIADAAAAARPKPAPPTLLVRLLSPAARLPERQTAGAAGFDLHAAHGVVLPPGGRALVGTGLAVAVPDGFEGQVRPRSGLALKHGVTVLNAPGTIDADYRGEVGVLLINLGAHSYEVHAGDRIAQLVVAPLADVRVVEARDLDATARGAGGYGSSGT